MKEITCQEVKRRLDANEDFKLVFCMTEKHFKANHIPGSINFPLHPEDTLNIKGLQERIMGFFSKQDDVVLYCTDVGCPASVFIYNQMEELGYEHIQRFSGGLLQWVKDGYELEGELA